MPSDTTLLMAVVLRSIFPLMSIGRNWPANEAKLKVLAEIVISQYPGALLEPLAPREIPQHQTGIYNTRSVD